MTITLNKTSDIHKTKVKKKLLRLDHNENPLGPSPLAIAAARHAISNCHRYPGRQVFELKKTLATSLNISTELITIGNGSDHLLELLAKTYLTTKNSAVIANFSFIGIKKIIQFTGTKLNIAHNTYKNLYAEHILAAVDKTTKAIFIVNPNNPTGNYIDTVTLEYLLNQLPSHILTIIDEAYGEYVSAPDYPNTIKLLSSYPNIIISRTFSKFYGLAGLRLGYLISHQSIAKHLEQLSLPFSVNSIALAAAKATLHDHEYIKLSQTTNQQGYKQLIYGLSELGLEAIACHTNFICVDFKKPSFGIYQKLLTQGIYVKPLHEYGLPHHLRVSIGLKNQNERFLASLHKILAP